VFFIGGIDTGDLVVDLHDTRNFEELLPGDTGSSCAKWHNLSITDLIAGKQFLSDNVPGRAVKARELL
jgi:hypothetical protein